jgi:hypothetical protein
LSFLRRTLEFFLARFGVRRERVFQQRFFLGLAVLGLGLVDSLQFGTLDRVQRGDFVVLGRKFLGLATTPARHFDGRKHVARRVDGGERFRIGRLADRRNTRDAGFRLVLRIVRLGGHPGGFSSHFGFGFLMPTS